MNALFLSIILVLISLQARANGENRACPAHAIEAFKIPPASADKNTVEDWKRQDADLHKFLGEMIPEALDHTGSAAFDVHLRGVQAVLRHWQADEELAKAGLFHSIYGTEGFQGYKLPLNKRPQIRNLIGERAERLAWIFCMVDRKSVDDTLYLLADEHQQTNRSFEFKARPELGSFQIKLTDENEWLNFIELSLADYLEQVEGAAEKSSHLFQWQMGEAYSYRRQAYIDMRNILVKRLGKDVVGETYNAVYDRESTATRNLHQVLTPPMSEAAREAQEALQSILL